MEAVLDKVTTSFNNLNEKVVLGFYKDVDYDKTNIPEEFDRIAKYYVSNLSNIKSNFHDYDSDLMHVFIYYNDICYNDKLSEGVAVTLCAYKGHEFEDSTAISNHMFVYYNEYRELILDVYDISHITEEEFYDCIIQELFNAYRDGQWIIDGTYEDNIEQMSIN